MTHPIVRDDLLRLNAEDAAMLLGLRALMAEGPHVRMVDIYDIDQRIAGHLRYLLLCGAPAVEIAKECLAESPLAGEVAVLAYLSMHLRLTGFHEELFELAETEAAAIEGLAWAFQRSNTETRRDYLRDWVASEDWRLVAAAVESAVYLRLNLREFLTPLLAHEHAAVRGRAFDYAGVMALTAHWTVIEEAMADEAVAFPAALAAARLGSPAAGLALLEGVGPGQSAARNRQAVEVGFLTAGEEVAREKVRPMLAEPETRHWGLLGLGVIGAVRTLDFLIAEMERPETSRMAGWAFSMITGANIAEDDLELEEFPDDPDEDDPVWAEDAEEEYIEAYLPWPDTGLVQGWMGEHGSKLSGEHPLLFGLAHWSYQDMVEPDLEYQGRYRALAQLMAARDPKAKLPNWRAPVMMQGRGFARDWQD